MADARHIRRVALAVPAGVPHLERIIHGVLGYAHRHGRWRVTMSPDFLALSIESLRDWPGDGVIARITDADQARIAARLDVPIVNISGALEDPGVSMVTVDNRAVGRLAAEHLLQCGFHRFAFYGPRHLWYAQRRAAGFIEAIEATGGRCACSPETPPPGDAGPSWIDIEERLRDWLAQLETPVGLLASSDYQARLVLEACEQLGLSVPDQVAVVGVNNDEIACGFCHPPLSSVACDWQRIGHTAAATLDALIDGDATDKVTTFLPPSGVTRRRSTETLVVDDPRAAAAVQYIRDHIDQPIQVADVCEALDLSRRWLEQAFRQWIGCTPREYIWRMRVDRAKQLLLNQPRMKMNRVARLSGFVTTKTLRAIFKRLEGTSPSEFRRRQQGAPS
jgi:LacI family transcriptional regulator